MSDDESSDHWVEEDEETKVCDGAEIREELVKASQRDQAYLIILAGNDVGKIFKLPQGDTFIGRSRVADMRLEDDSISRRHVVVRLSGKQVLIEDLGSANGTLVNGLRVKQFELQDGDKIQVGETAILKFTYHDRLDETFQQGMYDAALRDGLTRIYNKRYFTDQLDKELKYARRHKSELSLLMMDLDHFKQVNDVHGHVVGDQVLVELAQLIERIVRAEDIFARYGGEEFALIARSVGLVHAGVLGERIRAAVMSQQFCGESKLHISISIGIACFDRTMESGTELILAADAALYIAKARGRNRVALGTGPRSDRTSRDHDA